MTASGTPAEQEGPRWCCLYRWFPRRAPRRLRPFATDCPDQRAMRERFLQIREKLGDGVHILMPPIRFSEYFHIKAEVGKGAYGTVFRGEATELGLRTHKGFQPGMMYAVKRVRRPTRGVAEEIGRSLLSVSPQRHVEFVQALNGVNPHVVNFVGVFVEAPTMTYMVMENLEGPDLFDWVANRTTTVAERDAAILASQIVTAVHFLHRSVGALHRDIKPENLGFVRPVQDSGPLPRLKLFDLGCAWVLPEPVKEDKASMLLSLPRCGTQIYMAPETWDGRSGPPSDVWACGLVVYLLLSRELPFQLLRQKTARRAVEQNALVFETRIWENISAPARRFVQGLLEKCAEQRTTTSAALEDSWLQSPGNAGPVAHAAPKFLPARTHAAEPHGWPSIFVTQERPASA